MGHHCADERVFTAGKGLTEAAQRGGEVMAPNHNTVDGRRNSREPTVFAANGLCINGGTKMMPPASS